MWRTELARRFDERADTKRVRYDQRAGAIKRADIQFERNDKPVVAIRQRKLNEQHAREIGWTSINRAEVDLRIFEFPKARRWHTRKTYGRRYRSFSDLLKCFIVRTTKFQPGIKVKRIPVQMAFEVLLRC